MVKDKDKITSAALALPPKSRLMLAERLLASLDDPDQEGIDNLWAQEAEDRIDAFEEGELRAIPGDAVFRGLRSKRK